MNYDEIKKDLESVNRVLSEIFNPQKNAVTDYVLPILKNALVFLDEQQEKIRENKHIITKLGRQMRFLKQEKKDLQNNLEKEFNKRCLECDFKQVEFYNQVTQLQGEKKDLERELNKLKIIRLKNQCKHRKLNKQNFKKQKG